MDDEARQQAAAMWARGDYPQVGERLRDASVEVARALGAGPDDRVLDIGSGSGNTCVAVARSGATVTSLDLSDAWHEAVRAQAADAGVEVELVIGDAQDLPFEDGSFDAVVSCFAHIFAPDHEQVAQEMARVLRPGGRVSLGVWADGDLDDGFSALRRFVPAAPAGVGTPDQWGSRDHLDEVLGGAGIRVDEVTEHQIGWSFPSRDRLVEWLFEASGPWQVMRERIMADGRWDEAEEAMLSALDRSNRLEDGTYGRRMPYLVAVGTRLPA